MMKKALLIAVLFAGTLSAQEYPMFTINTFSGVDFGRVGFASDQGIMTQRVNSNVVGFGTSLNPYKGFKLDLSLLQRSILGPFMLDASDDLYVVNITQVDIVPTAQFAIENGGMFNFGAGVSGSLLNQVSQITRYGNFDLLAEEKINPIGFGGVLSLGYVQRISTNVNGFISYKYSTLLSNPELDSGQEVIITNNSIYAGVQVVF